MIEETLKRLAGMVHEIMKKISKLAFSPYPLRIVLAQNLKSALRGFSREHYFVCVDRAVRECVPLGIRELSAIEFGVAEGKGLIELERICAFITREHKVAFDIFGFDLATGLPSPRDYRDTPWKWGEGWYSMDRSKLETRLKSSHLVIGDLADTLPNFISNTLHSPLGAVMFDLDYYSSTKAALRIFTDTEPLQRLPRILCYFDDVGSIEDVGVVRAIGEFNQENERMKLKPQLYWQNHPNPYVKGWKIYELHDFDHPHYNRLVREENQL